MKAPRELLLERHQTATAQLDAIRREVLRKELPPAASPLQEPANWLSVLWQQLIWPSRRAWSVLATTWAVILVLGALSSGQEKAHLPEAAAPSPQVMTLLQEQKLLRRELLGAGPMASGQSATSAPRPHSQGQPPPGPAAGFRMAGSNPDVEAA